MNTLAKMHTSKLAISIVTYKTNPKLLLNCLNCIYNSNITPEVSIIDNSPDDQLKSVCEKFSCTYYKNPSNPGYGPAHNIAIANSIEKGIDYHLVLNADVGFHSNVLGEIINFMENNPNIGQVMPKVLNPDGSIQRLCKLVPTPIDLLLRRFMPKRFSVQMRRKFELWDTGYKNIMFVPYLSGCFMFLRCSALKDIGIFDERFFMYPEDIDLTRRMAVKYDTIFYPNVTVTHDHGAASYKSLRMLWIHMYNIFKYFNKWGWFFDDGRRRLNNKTLSLISGRLQK